MTVMEAGQLLPATKKNAILFKPTKVEKAGWPKIKYGSVQDDFYRMESWIEIHEFEISVVLRRPVAPEADTVSALDVSEALKQWFNGTGCAKLRTEGVSCFIAKDAEDKKRKDDSDLTQNPSTFPVRLCVNKTVKFRHNIGEMIEPDIKPV